MEIKFSCGENGISAYLDDGWIILKEYSQEKFVLGNLFPPQKIVIWKKIKVVKLQSQTKLEKENLFIRKKL